MDSSTEKLNSPKQNSRRELSSPDSQYQHQAYDISSPPSHSSGTLSTQQLELSPTARNMGIHKLVHLDAQSYQSPEHQEMKSPLRSCQHGSSQRLTHMDLQSSPSQLKLTTNSPLSKSSSYSSPSRNSVQQPVMYQMLSHQSWQQPALPDYDQSDRQPAVTDFRKPEISVSPHEGNITETNNENRWHASGNIKEQCINNVIHKLPWQQSIQQQQQGMFASHLLPDSRTTTLNECLSVHSVISSSAHQLVDSAPASFAHPSQPVFSSQKQNTHTHFSCQQIIPTHRQTELKMGILPDTYHQHYQHSLSMLRGSDGGTNRVASNESSLSQKVQPCRSDAHGYMNMHNSAKTVQEGSVFHDDYHAKRQTGDRNTAVQVAFRSQPFQNSVDKACAVRDTLAAENKSKCQNKEVSKPNPPYPEMLPGQERIQGHRLPRRAADNLLRRTNMCQNDTNHHGRLYSPPNENSRKKEHEEGDMDGENKAKLDSSHANRSILGQNPFMQGNHYNMNADAQSSQVKKRMHFGQLTSLSKQSSVLGRKRNISSETEISSKSDSAKTKKPGDENQPIDVSPSEKEDTGSATKKQRFLKTAQILEKSGLMDITLKTAAMLQNSHRLQVEIDEVRAASKRLLISVLNNPENRRIKQEVLTKLNVLIDVKSEGNESNDSLL